MSGARDLTQRLGGRWHGRYGACPCPVCQTGRHPGQDALTVAHGDDGRRLAHCKKLGCAFADILATGVTPGGFNLPDLTLVAQRERARRAEAEKRARQAYA